VNRRAYLLDNRAPEAGARFRAFADIFDPSTFRHMIGLGLARGWHCWEVGAGGTSVIRWLAEEVGPTGRVLATDIDLSWAHEVSGSQVELLHHDVAHDEAPAERFDLVHARLVLVHLPDRDKALRSMVHALKPGGWLLIEDADPALQPLSCLDAHGPNQELANRIRKGFRSLLDARGADLTFGRRLPRLLREAGLVDVAADAYFPFALQATIPLEIATIGLIRAELIAHRLATADEIDLHLANAAAGLLDLAQPPMISARGRRPQEA
jgi:SAM-dependent methyltransferase